MGEHTYVYVDGESHYIRSEVAWQKLYGPTASLERLRFKDTPTLSLVCVKPTAKIFWTRRTSPGCRRTMYFTSVVGDERTEYDARVCLRELGLEATIIRETRQRATRRKNILNTRLLIEKPKGVDIQLAVNMLEGAFGNFFEECHLYTSDVDFVPVVQAIRARGKRVIVFGYKEGLADCSEWNHVPDQFVDLTETLLAQCEPIPEDNPPSKVD